MTDPKKADQLTTALLQFTGSTQCHRWSRLTRLVMTDGVQYLAKEAGAYWLLDAIASYQNSPQVKGSRRLQEIQFWTLSVNGSQGILECVEDSGEPPIVRQEIPYTDFPLKEIKLYVCNGVIFLPSEY